MLDGVRFSLMIWHYPYIGVSGFTHKCNGTVHLLACWDSLIDLTAFWKRFCLNLNTVVALPICSHAGVYAFMVWPCPSVKMLGFIH